MVDYGPYRVERDFAVSGDEAIALVESARLQGETAHRLLGHIARVSCENVRADCRADGPCMLSSSIQQGMGFEHGPVLRGRSYCTYADGCPNTDFVDEAVGGLSASVADITTQHKALRELLPQKYNET